MPKVRWEPSKAAIDACMREMENDTAAPRFKYQRGGLARRLLRIGLAIELAPLAHLIRKDG